MNLKNDFHPNKLVEISFFNYDGQTVFNVHDAKIIRLGLIKDFFINTLNVTIKYL